MREYWKKASLLYKLIAVLLTVVMVGTSLYFHFDRRYSAKAQGGSYMARAYIDATDSDWKIIDDDNSVGNVEGRQFAYVFCWMNGSIVNIETLGYQQEGSEEVPSNNAEKTQISVSNSSANYNYYIIKRVDFNDTTQYKCCYKDTIDPDHWTVYTIQKFTWTSDLSNTISAHITSGGVEAPIEQGGNYALKKGDSVTAEVKTTTALTAFSVFGDTVDLTQEPYASATKDSQSQLYTYTYTKSFNSDDNVASVATSVTATNGGGAMTPLSCNYAYDATEPTILAKVGTANLEDRWFNANQVTFTLVSGNTVNESNLASYSITEGESTLSNNNSVGAVSATPTVSFANGTHDVTVTATDVAGNTTSTVFTVKIDQENPSVSSIDVSEKNSVDGTNYVKLNSDDKVIISGTISEAFSGIAGVQGLVFRAEKNGSGGFATNHDYTLTEGTGSYNYSISLADILGSNVYFINHNNDATYEVWVTPTDIAGNTGSASQHITFVLDTTAPELTGTYNTDVFIQRHSVTSTIYDETADGFWEDVPASEVVNGKYLVNKVKYNKIRYKVKATDTNFGTLKFVSGETDKQPYDTKSADDWYYCEVPLNDITKASAVEYSVTATDKALNETTAVLPSLQEVNSDLTVNLVSIMYNGQPIVGEVNSVTDLSSYFNSNYNGIYTVTLNVTSGYPVALVSLNKNGTVYTSYSLADSTITNTADGSGVYVTNNLTFILPKSSNANELLNSMSIYVEDTNTTPRTTKLSLGDLLYDNTKPVVKNTNAFDKNKWYQSYELKYEVKSGSNVEDSNADTITESNLKSAGYSIDGGAANIIDVSSGVKIKKGTIDVPESTSALGTKVVFDATDNATNTIDTASATYPNQIYIKVDKTAPSVAPITVNGEAVNESVVLAGAPQLTSTVTDNLTIGTYDVDVKYNDETDSYANKTKIVNSDATQEGISYTLDELLGGEELKDGKYTVSIAATDKSGRISNVSSTAFIVDNTVPVVTADIISGTSGKNNAYYNTDVTVRFTCKDNNFNPAAMVVTDNGNVVDVNWQVGNDVWYADLVCSSQGLHDVRVSGNDKAGNPAVPKQVIFTIDKTVPTVSLLINGGQVYNESRGTLNLTGPLTLTASVSDINEDAGDLRIQVIKTVPDTATTTSDFIPTGERTFSFADEADYTVNIFAIDKANNQGPTRTISFRVDATAPQLTITGANGGTSSAATTVSFNLNEAFWSDAKGTVEIYRKAGDGVDEVLFKTLTLTPTQKNYSLSETLTESGIYRFEFTANDKVGHTATTSQKVTVDRNKPEITLTGVKNYDATDGEVSISAVIKDEFYANKKVSISGTRIDPSGKKVPLSFSPFAATANPTTISDTFKEDGIYDITITSTDIAGNVASSSVHFTIDTSEPVIGDLSQFDGKTFKSIDLDSLDLDSLVSDLTVCEVRMYLNGSEYDGLSEIEDGSYTLLITAEDELGHKTEKTATFVLDTKVPVFIVTGVEDGEVKDENYSIEVSLQLDEDTLEKVTLNGKDVSIKDNEASFNVTEKGNYELYMKAVDEAGNEAEQTITFTFGDESVANAVSDAVEKAAGHWWLWAIVIAAIFLAGGFIFFIIKRRERD